MTDLPAAEALFAFVNPLPIPAWLLLAVAPRWRYTMPVVRLLVIPLLAVAYVVLIGSRVGATAGNFNSLAGVQALFADPYTLLAGWIHYLAFDLFVGAWITEDALLRRVPVWARIVPLPFTFLFGPAGLLLYLVLRQTTVGANGNGATTGVAAFPSAATSRSKSDVDAL